MPDGTQKSDMPLIPAVTDRSGEYTHTIDRTFEWTYEYDIHATGTKSERRIGRLQAPGLGTVLAEAKPGDHLPTPWGLMVRTRENRYERGFLLEHTHGQPFDPAAGRLLEVPEKMLDRGGLWKAHIGAWRYGVSGEAMTTRSERRMGWLAFGRRKLVGRKQGDYVDTPWGRLRWMGPVNSGNTTDYEQGFLLRGTYDNPLDDMEGDPIFPNSSGVALRLESLYLDSGFRVAARDEPAHGVSLLLSGSPDHDVELWGTLLLDPNQCTLNKFGDREGCTRMARREVPVKLTLQRLEDPKGLHRRYFEVTGDELPLTMALVVMGELQRCYLVLERQLVPLYVDDGV